LEYGDSEIDTPVTSGSDLADTIIVDTKVPADVCLTNETGDHLPSQNCKPVPH
jgi:hypothetical protein